MASVIGARIVLVITILLFIYLFVHFIRYLQLIHPTDQLSLENDICLNENLILDIQREQFLNAKREIFGSEDIGFQGTDMDFYRRAFGSVELKIMKQQQQQAKVLESSKSKTKAKAKTKAKPSSSTEQQMGKTVAKDYHELVFYRIWKNANTNIFSLMVEYAYEQTNDRRNFLSQNCNNEVCVHPHIQTLSSHGLKHQYVPLNRKDRYPFIFVRDPITRFISGLSEIEYRVKEKNNASITFPFKNELGSQLRVQEFINMILLNGGSSHFYHNYDAHEITHIYPMIGTYRIAEKVESKRPFLYRFESFDEEIARLSEDSNLPMLKELSDRRNATKWKARGSSKDPYKTTIAAKSLFSYGSMDAYNKFFEASNRTIQFQRVPTGFILSDYQRVAKGYVRAICRLYLIDFKCFNYTLPKECEDLEEEFQLQVSSHYAMKDLGSFEDRLLGFVRYLIPDWILDRLAYLICFMEDGPQCYVRIIHGLDKTFRERHEEL